MVHLNLQKNDPNGIPQRKRGVLKTKLCIVTEHTQGGVKKKKKRCEKHTIVLLLTRTLQKKKVQVKSFVGQKIRG